MKKFLRRLYKNSANLRKKNILNFLEENSDAVFLDLGCDDGKWTMEMAKKINTDKVFGVEIIESRASEAKKSGVNVVVSDLNEIFPFENDMFDVIHADQVIEHVAFVDNFISEIYRVLKPGGYIVIGTESNHSLSCSFKQFQCFLISFEKFFRRM